MQVARNRPIALASPATFEHLSNVVHVQALHPCPHFSRERSLAGSMERGGSRCRTWVDHVAGSRLDHIAGSAVDHTGGSQVDQSQATRDTPERIERALFGQAFAAISVSFDGPRGVLRHRTANNSARGSSGNQMWGWAVALGPSRRHGRARWHTTPTLQDARWHSTYASDSMRIEAAVSGAGVSRLATQIYAE